YARFQETFAAMLDHCDAQIGRVLAYLESIGEIDNTLTILVSDNGAEGGSPTGAFINNYNQVPSDPAENLPNIDKIGGPLSHSSYPRGWSQVGNTPLKRYKLNTHGGGVRDPFIVHWPARIKDGGALRTQFLHMTDVMPTLLEILDVEAPAV